MKAGVAIMQPRSSSISSGAFPGFRKVTDDLFGRQQQPGICFLAAFPLIPIGNGLMQLSFTDDETLDRATRFAALPVDEQRRILAEQQTPFELPDQDPSNPTRRAERVAEEAAAAPKRATEERTRSVSVNRDAVK